MRTTTYSDKITVYEFKDVDVTGATVIEGFPTVGLVSSIAANYLIGVLHMDQIAALDSPDFPPVSMVYAFKPKFPARIYVNEGKNTLVVIISEFTPSPYVARGLAETIFKWSIEKKCKLIISPEGLAREYGKATSDTVFGIGSTDNSRKLLKSIEVPLLETGIITGVSGSLLNLGRIFNYDVISLLIEVVMEEREEGPMKPDAKAAAKIIETIDKLLPEIDIDVTPLYEEYERIESNLRTYRKQAKPVEYPPLPMYR